MKALRPKTVTRMQRLLDERGVKHDTMDNTQNQIAAIVAFVPDDDGNVTEFVMDAETLICDLTWLDLPITSPLGLVV